MIFKHTSSLMQIHTLGLYSIIDLPIPSSSFNNLFECSMFQVIIHSLYIHSTTIRNPCLLWCSKNTWKCQKIRQWCPRKHHLKFDQPKHAKSWKKLNSTCIMFILTCVVKHAFQHLEVVPCGSHVMATWAPSWTGSATCPRFSSGPLEMWQMTGPAKINCVHGGIRRGHGGNTRGWCVSNDVDCHVIALFGGLGFRGVFRLMSPATHGYFREHRLTFHDGC